MNSASRFTRQVTRQFFGVFALILSLFVAGCTGGSRPITIAVSPNGAQAVDFGQSVTLTAAVANDAKNAGATWTLSGPGSLTNQTTTGATYVAPTTGAGGTATITATAVSLTTASASVTINVTPPPSITTTSLPAGTEGTAYSQSVKESGGAGTLAYSLSSGTLPAGLTMSSAGAISGTPTGPNTTANFTVKVTDGSSAGAQTATQALSIAINLPPAPAITTTTLPADVEGTAYSQTIAVTGGLAPLTYSVSAGSLPAGLSLNASTGAITGTPSGPNGTVSFTIKVADSSNPVQSATQALSITVNLPPAPSISTTSLPAVTEGAAYSQNIAATGFGTLTYSVSLGSLPAGLSLNASTGAITGTPSGPNGTVSFTIKVADSSNPVQSATQALSIAVNLPPAPTITTTSLPAVVEFASYNQTVTASSGLTPYTWSISAGSLPAGLSLNASTGAITGTPSGPNGTVSFTIKVADSSNPVQSATQALSIAVNLPPAPTITTTSLPNGTIGAAYSQNVGVSGGQGPFTWSISAGALPTGLSQNASTGAISGNPSATGVSNFTVKIVDSSNPAQSATQALSITIVNGPLTVTAATLPTGAVNDVYPGTTLGASGGLPPYTWSITVGSLPAGLTLNASTGAVSGTPTGPSGTANFTAQVKDSTNATATGSFSITVNPALAVSTTPLPGATVGTSYTTNLAATGGVTPYTWNISAGSLPGGLSLSGNTISGIPTASGTFNFTVQATDAAGGTATANLSIVVAPAQPLTVTSTSNSLPAGTLNATYPTTNLIASGGVQPYTWSITVGSLPTGLTLNVSTGAISGTPTASGTFNFTAQVKDSTNATATAALSITVNAIPCAGYGTGSESKLHGQYAILTQGFAGTGALVGFAGLGSFAADGTGKITAGEFDINGGHSGPQHLTVLATGSSYVLGSDNRGCMQINFGGVNAVTFHFAVGGINAGVAAKGRLIEFDDTTGTDTRDSGVLRLQTTTDFALGSLNARYAFGMDGTDSTGGHESIGGTFNLNTSTGAISNGVADVDDAGTLPGGAGGFTGGTGSIGAISASTGRATGSFAGGTGATFNLAYYVVNKNELFVITTDVPGAGKPAASGRMLVTGSSYSSASLSGKYILHLTGSGGGSADATLGLLTLSGGSINGSLFEYKGGIASTNTITAGTYSVSSTTGRVTVASAGTHPPVLYLATATDGISAFIVGTDNSAIFGAAEVQPAATYSVSSLSGAFFFGTDDGSDNTIKNQVGTVTLSSGTVSGLEDSSQPTSPFLKTAGPVSATITVNSDGTGTVGPQTISITNGSKLFFIDESGGPAVITVVEQ